MNKHRTYSAEELRFERVERRLKVWDTDTGAELRSRIADLRLLLDAYRDGAVAEKHGAGE